jgi:uncharacterized membrane protein
MAKGAKAMNSRQFWFTISAFSGAFWGSLIGLLIYPANVISGYLAGVIGGWMAASLVILLAGVCINASVADDYRMHA